jgi:hypothetical protein
MAKQKVIAFALFSDGRLWTMTGPHHYLISQGYQFPEYTVHQHLHRSPWQIHPAYATLK